MRLLILLGNLEFGGAERMALELATGLRERGEDVVAAAMRGGPMIETWNDAGIEMHAPLLKFRFDLWASRRIAGILRERDIDTLLIADVYRNAMLCGLWAARHAGRQIRTLLWCSAVPTGQAGDFTPRLMRALGSGLDEIVCVSENQRGVLSTRGLDASRLHCIRNGIHIESFLKAPRPGDLSVVDGPRWVQVANVMPDKDFDTLIDAAEILRDREVKLEIDLVGRGTDARRMHREIHRRGLEEIVCPLGARADVPSVLGAADGFVLSSRSEVCNVAVMEAMAAGLPCVVSDIPGLADVAGEAALTFHPGDAEALAGRIETLTRDETRRDELAGRSKHRAREFTREGMCEAFAKLLREMPSHWPENR